MTMDIIHKEDDVTQTVFQSKAFFIICILNVVTINSMNCTVINEKEIKEKK